MSDYQKLLITILVANPKRKFFLIFFLKMTDYLPTFSTLEKFRSKLDIRIIILTQKRISLKHDFEKNKFFFTVGLFLNHIVKLIIGIGLL